MLQWSSNPLFAYLLSILYAGSSCYRPRKKGERKRKSVRGCIVSSELSVLNLVIVKVGAQPFEGVTDIQPVRRLQPKRVSKLRRLFVSAIQTSSGGCFLGSCLLCLVAILYVLLFGAWCLKHSIGVP